MPISTSEIGDVDLRVLVLRLYHRVEAGDVAPGSHVDHLEVSGDESIDYRHPLFLLC